MSYDKVIQGQKLRKSSEYGKFKINSLHEDHPPAWSNYMKTGSVGVKIEYGEYVNLKFYSS